MKTEEDLIILSHEKRLKKKSIHKKKIKTSVLINYANRVQSASTGAVFKRKNE